MLIDDDLGLRDSLERLLTGRGHSVAVCAHGPEDWRDRSLPEMDLVVVGPRTSATRRSACLERLSRVPPDRRPFVLIVAESALAIDAESALEAGADDVVTGPFTPEHTAVRLRLVEREIARRAERRRDLAALRESEERYRALVELSPDGIVVQSDRRVVFANMAAARMFGARTPEELLGKGTLELIHPDGHPRALARLRDLEHGGLPMPFEERKILRLDGSVGQVEIGVCMMSFRGRPAIQSVVRDLAERKAAERAVRESEERYRALVELSPDGIVINVDGRVVFANSAALAMLGAGELSEVIGRNVMDFVHPRHHDEVRARVSQVLNQGSPVPFAEMDFRRMDGSVLRVESKGTRMDFGARHAIHVTFRDLTERKRLEGERARIERRLQEAQKLESLGVLAGGIAHDFNNLLTGVLGNASLARAGLPAGTEAHRCLDAIEQAALRAAELCREMLAYSGRGRFVLERVSLNALVQDTLQLLEHSVHKGAAVRVSFAEELPTLLVDATQIRQILMNLVMNASDALEGRVGTIHLRTGRMFADGALLRRTVLAPELPEGEYVVLEVADTGRGMSAETMQRIFEPFFTTKFTGRGLGLAAVLGIVRGHNGALDVESAPGRGSIFRLLLPPAPPQAAVVPGARPAREPESWRGCGTVLVVDDEELVRRLAVRILEETGFRVVAAASGEEALRLHATGAEGFRLALLDLTMPPPDGVETARRLRERDADLPLVLMSGYAEEEVTARLGGIELAGFVQKPFTASGLRGVLRQVLAGTTGWCVPRSA